MRYVSAIVCGALILMSFLAHAEIEPLIFSAAPTHDEEKTKELYGGLVEYLSKELGRKVELRPANNFMEYSVGLKNAKYNITFDGPHLASWMMVEHGYTPVAKVPGEISVAIIVKENSKIDSLEKIYSSTKGVCAFASPNLLTMAFLQLFNNPARQPLLHRNQGFNEVKECLDSNKGDVAVVRLKVWKKKMDQKGLRLFAVLTDKFPERTFSVGGGGVTDDDVNKIRQLLTSEEATAAMKGFLSMMGKKQGLVPAYPVEYKGFDDLLRVLWIFK